MLTSKSSSGFNPCFNGYTTFTMTPSMMNYKKIGGVSILVLMDILLLQHLVLDQTSFSKKVSILVLMDILLLLYLIFPFYNCLYQSVSILVLMDILLLLTT